MPLLSLILWLPLLGALSIACLPPSRQHWIRPAALANSGLVLALAVALLFLFDSGNSQVQLAESLPWNPRLGSSYALGVDGLSLPMVLLAALLSFVALLASHSLTQRIKGYYVGMLMLETGMLGVFLAQDWALFYLFWELTLIPLFLLIDRWGGARCHQASLTFVLYTMGGSAFMLISLIMLYQQGGSHASTMAAMAEAAVHLSPEQQWWVFLGFLVAFGVKIPIIPLHGWLPLAHVEAPSPVSILLSGILLKMGAYGLLRVGSMLPQAMEALQPWLAGLGFASIVYGGLLAWRQSDMKAMIAYSSISHMGLVVLGIACLNPTGLMGAMVQMVAHGLVAGSLFLLIGLLYERTHTREIADYSSLIHATPRFAVFTTLAFLAAIGLPGTAGFVAELYALIGGFQRWGWWMLLMSAGLLISVAYAMRTISRLFTGPVRPAMQQVPDLCAQELAGVGVLAAGVLYLGLAPAALLQTMGAAVARLSALLAPLP